MPQNWVVPRLKKFYCFATHFNVWPVMVAALAAAALILACMEWGYPLSVLQSFVAEPDPSLGKTEHGLGCTSLMTRLLVLCLGHGLQRWLGCGGCSMFLD